MDRVSFVQKEEEIFRNLHDKVQAASINTDFDDMDHKGAIPLDGELTTQLSYLKTVRKRREKHRRTSQNETKNGA